MKLGILSALWGRPELTTLFLDRLDALREKLDVLPIVVGTDYEFSPQCITRWIKYQDFQNKPLGAKWNAGMEQFKKTDVTHVMILGSDDFVSDRFVGYIKYFAEDKDFCGCKDMYMFGANPRRKGWQQMYYFRYKGYLVGPGRTYSRGVLEKLNWRPWADYRNYGLDASVAKKLKSLGSHVKRGSFVMKDEGLFMVDIKTTGNISGIPGGAKPIDNDFMGMLSDHLPRKEARNLADFLIKKGALTT